MRQLLDSGALRVIAYPVVALVALLAARRDRRTPGRSDRERWTVFWYASALLLVVMGAARAGGYGELVTEFGREHARVAGWYATRRDAQVAVVLTVSVLWFVTVAVALWRVPERRRRYLPAAVALFTLVCFAAIRVVSLHHVDTLLYRRDLGGVRVVALAELGLLVSCALSMMWFPLVRSRPAAVEVRP